MKYQIISDIHANVPALEACLAHAEKDVTLLHLGDLVGYGPNPNEIVEMLLDTPGVVGNHDKAAIGEMDIRYFNDEAALGTIWTKNALTQKSIDYLKKLPYTTIIPDSQGHFTLSHGSPSEPHKYHYIQYEEDAWEAFNNFETQVCFMGHSHFPESYSYKNDEIIQQKHGLELQPHEDILHLKKDTRYLINVGSIGQPRDRNPKASYAIFDTDKMTVTWHRVSYDIPSVQKAILATSLPESNAKRLPLGR